MTIQPDVEIESGSYNTSNSNLWSKVWDYFNTELKEEWAKMRQDRFTLDNLMEYIYNQQIAQIPAKMYNDDAQVKYLEFGSLYTYCCHGNKEHQIRRWLRERIAYVDSMLGYFTSQDDQVTIRMNKSGPVSFSVTTYIPLYFSVKWSNATGGTQTIKMKRGETKEFSYNSTTSTDQEVIIYHAQYIKDLSNLSNLNPSSCILANALKLTNVEIHSPLLYNINVTNNKYLRNINLRNCTALGTVTATGSSLDLSKCKYLQHCDIYKTNLTEVQLGSEGGSLLDIFYPKSVQTIQLIKQRLLHTIGLPYGNNGDEIPTSLYTVTIQECPNITKLNTSTNAAINSSFVSMSYCNNLTIRNSLDLEELNFDGFHRLKNVVVENMYNLTSVGFNDLLPKGETSTIQYIGMSNCPKLETLELNCTSNDYEITFADKAVLNLGGLFGLKSITSNCVLKGIETIVVPAKLESMFFTNEYGEGYSSIKNIWVSSVCDVNTSGSTAKVTYVGDSNYSGIDFNGMNLKNIDLGALVNIPNAINFNIAPTTVNPHFNLNRDGETYPYLQPEGSIDLTNYTESLARFFDGIDLDKLQIICKGSMPQTDLSYCFYNATFSKLQSITTLLNKVANIINLDYCFYKTTINNTSVISSIKMGTNSTMNYTFAECPNITTLNNITIPKNVVAVEGMFYKCPLTSINSMIVNVQGSIKGLFKGCENLTSITTLLIPNVTDVESTFEGCVNLETLTGFNLPTTCTNVSNLFKGCYKLTRLTGLNLGSTITKGDNWCPPNLTTVENCTINTDKSKFKNVVSLTTVQDTNITGDDLSDLFNGCTKLGNLKNCSITANRSLARAFKNCNLITQSHITVIKDSVTNIDEMFSGCTGITDISGMTFGSGITSATNWIPPNLATADNVTIKNNVVKFGNCSTLLNCRNLTISNNVTTLEKFVYGCTSLSNFTFNKSSNLSNVKSIKCFMCGNKLIEVLDFSGFNLTSLDIMGGVGENLGFIANTNVNTVNFTDCVFGNRKISWIWLTNNCKTQKSITFDFTNAIMPLIDFNRMGWGSTAKIYFKFNGADFKYWTTFARMFATDATHINGVDFTGAKISHITDFSNMFNATGLTQANFIEITEDIVFPPTATNVEKAFYGCTKLTHIHSNWNNSYSSTITSTDCYSGCTGITHIDDKNIIAYNGDDGLDYVPLNWGGNGFTKDNTMILEVKIPNNNYLAGICRNVNRYLTEDINKSKVNWGDGNRSELINQSGNAVTHTYSKSGTYIIKSHVHHYDVMQHDTIKKCITRVIQMPRYKNGKKIDDFSNTFMQCSNLLYADFSNILTEGLTPRTFNTFNNCSNLQTVVLPKNLALGYSAYMFGGCGNLTNIVNIDSMIMKHCKHAQWMFSGCGKLGNIDVSDWEMNMLDAEGWSCAGIFNACSSMTYFDVSKWNTSTWNSLSAMFAGTSIESIDLSGWVSTKNSVKGKKCSIDISSMFRGCSKLKQVIGLEKILDSAVNNVTSLFSDCTSLVDISCLDNCDFSNVTSISYIFKGCTQLTTIDFNILSNYNFSKLYSMGYAFNNCSNLTTIIFPENQNCIALKNVMSSLTGTKNLIDIKNLPLINFKDNTLAEGQLDYIYYAYGNIADIKDNINISFADKITAWKGFTDNGYVPKLFSKFSAKTIDNIVNALYDYSSVGITKTLDTKGYISKFTDEQLLIASNKGWTIT